MRYRREIDGLRAVAVIPVILFHAGFASFSGGFVGVDVFFVISGFLITSILLADLSKGSFSLLKFYERRARRILPVLFFVMLCCTPFAWWWLMPLDFEDYLQSVVAVSTFSSNILFWLESDYFATASELKPLLHTWSLAVEEQYYIFFPLLLMGGWAWGRRRLLIALSVLFVASLCLAQWAAYTHAPANFFLLPSRGWELLIGAFAAFYTTKHGEISATPLTHQSMSMIGLVSILASVVLFDVSVPFPSVYALLPTLGTVAIILFAREGTWVHRVLGLPVLVGVGLISYSAYLWHQPIFAFTKYTRFSEPSEALMLSLAVASFGLSYLSWRFVENPFRSRQRFSQRAIFKGAGVASVAMIGAASLALVFGVSPRTQPELQLSVGLYHPENRQLQADSWTVLRQTSGDEKYGVDNNPFDHTLWFDDSDDRSKLLVVGNSHSKDMYNLLSASPEASKRFQIARFGVEIANIDAGFFASPNYQAADTVIFVSQYKRVDFSKLGAPVIASLAAGKRTAVVKNIYEFEEFLNRTYADFLFQMLLGEMPAEEITPADIQKINHKHYVQFTERKSDLRLRQSDEAIEQLAAQQPKLVVLDRMDYVCDHAEQTCWAMDDQFQKYFYDYAHHTVEGVRFFGQRIDTVNWLGPIMNEAVLDD